MASSSSMSASSTKKSKGRQKVKMQRMENDSNRQVTFSKRRCGLFKKASELCTLCGAEAAIIVFSPGRKPFSFGHPSVDTIIKRFLLSTSLDPKEPEPENPKPQGVIEVIDLNADLTILNMEFENEKRKSKSINEVKKANSTQNWWDRELEEFSIGELIRLKTSLEELSKHVIEHSKKVMIFNSSIHVTQFPYMAAHYPPMMGCYDAAYFTPNVGFMGCRDGHY
ncbi:agamous-like MADS-box protein AGL62 [Amaranthus tricolor]|uniref:agamous-like MADS-box protein AGL62 n=1 Tax=Amaranthus tricolor TaxID=29722 RepID=UPI00258B4256|nr:agamous-like MADS-box protein AGL62 [Amaranthus tricolor]